MLERDGRRVKFPEIRVTRIGPRVHSVVWDPCDGPGIKLEMDEMKVRQVAATITPGDIPTVTVTFIARLVEVEA